MYIGIAGQEKGTCINDCDAYQYALEQMQWNEELKKRVCRVVLFGELCTREGRKLSFANNRR